MTDHDALYRAILAHPDDDTPRLVYADWLEENGRTEEAEFIRVECRLEADAPGDDYYCSLLDRREELRLWLRANVEGPEVKLPARLRIEGGTDWWNTTHRGFPRFLEYVGLPVPPSSGMKLIRAVGPALEKVAFERIPTRWLSVRSITVAELAELLRHPAVSRLDQLTVQLNVTDDPQDEACQVIAAAPHLAGLAGLHLNFPVGDIGAAALAASKCLAGLRALSLHQSTWLSPSGVRALGSAPWFHRLQRLDLSELDDAAFEELCRLDPFPELHTLELRESSFPTASWREFARTRAFPRLKRFVNDTELASGQAATLAEAGGFQPAHLELGSCAIGNDGALALAQAPWLDSLAILGLSFNMLSASGFAAIAGSRRLTRLRSLDLSYNAPGGRGLRALAANPVLNGLTTLRLHGSFEHSRGLKPSHFHAFLSNLNMPNLRRLELARRPLGARAARVLEGKKFASLTRLNLAQCRLSDTAMASLVRAPALEGLIEFDAAQNGLKTGVAALADRRFMPRLSAGNFAGNRISRDLARKLNRRSGIHA
jgi:uncharacterized protein (TIGR02996 family)